MKTWHVIPVLSLVIAGCAGTGNRPPETQAVAPSATASETTPADAPLPPVVIAEGGITPPDEVESPWKPALAVVLPSHWEAVPHGDLKSGEYGRVVSAKWNASISFVTSPSKGPVVEEAVMIQTDMIKRGFRVTEPIDGDADPNRTAFGWIHPESKTRGYVVVRHYGTDGHVSFVFLAAWPSTLSPHRDAKMHRTLETFVNNTQLLSQ